MSSISSIYLSIYLEKNMFKNKIFDLLLRGSERDSTVRKEDFVISEEELRFDLRRNVKEC